MLELPSKAPQTKEEALEISQIMGRTPQGIPGLLQITDYKERFILPQSVEWWKFFPLPIGLLPAPIWLGAPPIPWALWEMVGPTQKPIKGIIARLLPKRIPEAHMYVIGTHIEGVYETELSNLGEAMINPLGTVREWLYAVKRETAKIWDLLRGEAKGNEQTPPKQVSTLTFKFTVMGFWSVLTELWQYLWTRTIDVDWSADVHIPGYETEDYITPDYDKHFEGKASLPIEALQWHAW